MVAVQKGLARRAHRQAAPGGRGGRPAVRPGPGPTTAAATAAAKAKAAAIAEALSKLTPPMAAAGINPD